MAVNQFKNNIKEKNEAKKAPKKERKIGRFSFFSNISNKFKSIVQNEKLAQITGLLLLVFSVFLLLAFSSYLFTWKADQNLIINHWDNPEVQAENWLGKLGAYAAHQFIFNAFGVASFLFCFLFFIVGFKALFKIKLVAFNKAFAYSLFTIVWLSVVLAYIFKSYPILGGTFGFQSTVWLTSIVGSVGVGLLLFLSLLIFIVLNFNVSFKLPQLEKMMEDDLVEETSEEEKPADEIDMIHEAALNEIEDDNNEEETNTVSLDEVPEELPEVEEKETESIALSTDIPENEEKNEGEIEFSVEEAKPDEKTLSEEELNQKAKDFGEYDPTLDLASFKMPPIELLKDFGDTQKTVTKEELEANKNKILATLSNYNIEITSIKATIGPTVTLYEIIPAPGIRISKIKNLEDDIALSLAALGIRIIAPIPGKGTIGIEVPNQNPEIVSMRLAIASDRFQNAKMELPVVLGKTITNENFVFDLAKMPHLLMAGATGQGKSVGLNAVLTSLLYKKHPSQLKFVLVDPKKVELTLYNKIERHYLAKLPDTEEAIITDNQKVINTLNSLCIEMDNRYELLKNAQVRNIVEYNSKFISRKLNPNDGHQFLPYIVLVIDEFADLIMTAGKEVETPIARLAQLARAIGIHLIIATQRPSANIITGIIKANFPGRIAFRVTSGIDSRTILDSSGADQLIGRGDMLISQGNDLTRVQCAFVDTPEVERICDFIGEQRGYPEVFTLPEYVGESSSGGSGTFDSDDKDDLFDDAARMIVQHQQGSASLLQRKMKIGYNRAGRLIDQLEEAGIIGPFEGSKARQVLMSDMNALEQFLKGGEDENS
ncbi:MAG: DNA translocase FtsK 4TM domain-containing protein [Vicingaceae bacterium]|nr:DNA translocase FtsK 4TM domain-containing protein [Vicingaceae bacterium]